MTSAETGRIRIGVDVDGVLGDFDGASLAIMKGMFLPSEVPDIENRTTWNFDALIPPHHREAFWAHLATPGFHRELRPYPGAKAGMQRLKLYGRVYIVTSPLDNATTWTHEREQWLAQHFGVHRLRVTHTHAKYAFDCDVLLDDNPAHVNAWAEEGHTGTPILWSQPYNEHTHLHPRVVRARGWGAALRLVDAFVAQKKK